MLKSPLQSRCWPNRPSARVVQQAALLLKELPRCFPGWSAKTVAQRADRFDLLWVAFLATATAEIDASTHPHQIALTAARYDGGSPTGRSPLEW